MYAGGDEGVNSLLVIRAEHFSQLAGNYSRVGFHHPGAALIYMLTAGEVVFHNLLHVAPSSYNAQILGVTVYSVTLLVLTGRRPRSAGPVAVGRDGRRRGRVPVHVGLPVAELKSGSPTCMRPPSSPSPSPPRWWPPAAPGSCPWRCSRAGSSCTGTCPSSCSSGSSAVVAVVAWWLAHRRHVREEARRARVALLVSLGLVVLFLLPLVLQTVRNFPGPWPAYLDFGATGERDPRSIGDAVRFVMRYWTETPWPVWLYVVAAVVLVVAAVRRPRRTARLAYAWLLGAVVLQTGMAVVYAYKGVDLLDQRYIEEFYKTVPLVVVLGAVTAAGSLLVSVRPPAAHGTVRVIAVRVVAPLAVAFMVVVAAQSPGDGLPAG